jgi:cell envelope opacity-associated protein A
MSTSASMSSADHKRHTCARLPAHRTGVAALREAVGSRHPTLWSTAAWPAKAAEVQLQAMPRQPEPVQQQQQQQQQRIPQSAGSVALQGGTA